MVNHYSNLLGIEGNTMNISIPEAAGLITIALLAIALMIGYARN